MLVSFAQIGNETPSHHHDLTLARVPTQSDNWLKDLRRYVPTRAEVRNGNSMQSEVLSDALLVRSADVTATHQFSLLRTIRSG
jgi:hypothetical protein